MKECAILRCSEETAGDLCSFGGRCFTLAWRRCTDGRSFAGFVNNDRDAWHLLESRAALPSKGCSKLYKLWLYERSEGEGGRLGLLESGAAMLLRDAVRDLWRKEVSQNSYSLDEPLGGSELTLGELLHGDISPVDEITERECRALAQIFAGNHFKAADRRERVGLLAQALGVGASQSWVTDMAGCGRSSVYVAVKAGCRVLVSSIKNGLPEEVPSVIHLVSLLALQELSDCAVRWGAENDEAAVFFDFSGK